MQKKKSLLLLLMAAIMLTGCANNTESKEEQTEDPTAITINGEAIGLREWNFYVRMNQLQWEKEYLDTYGDEMWDHEIDDEGTTLADNLKEDVLDTIIQVHLTNQHAEEYDTELSEEQKSDIRDRAASFMENYHEAILEYAGADEDFVYEKLSERELATLTAQASSADYEPELAEEDYRREGICYILLSTTGTRDEDGNLTPYSEEEVERRTQLAQELSVRARESGDLKETAEAEGLTAIESSMGADNNGDGQEPLMLDAARLLAVGEVSDPIQTEEGWFLVQHTSDYDEDGTEYWKEYLTEQAKEEESSRIYDEWEAAADIQIDQEILDQVIVKHVLKELL
jgi:hypothetical protein